MFEEKDKYQASSGGIDVGAYSANKLRDLVRPVPGSGISRGGNMPDVLPPELSDPFPQEKSAIQKNSFSNADLKGTASVAAPPGVGTPPAASAIPAESPDTTTLKAMMTNKMGNINTPADPSNVIKQGVFDPRTAGVRGRTVDANNAIAIDQAGKAFGSNMATQNEMIKAASIRNQTMEQLSNMYMKMMTNIQSGAETRLTGKAQNRAYQEQGKVLGDIIQGISHMKNDDVATGMHAINSTGTMTGNINNNYAQNAQALTKSESDMTRGYDDSRADVAITQGLEQKKYQETVDSRKAKDETDRYEKLVGARAIAAKDVFNDEKTTANRRAFQDSRQIDRTKMTPELEAEFQKQNLQWQSQQLGLIDPRGNRPDFASFVEQVRIANPGKTYTDEDLKDTYNKMYGGY